MSANFEHSVWSVYTTVYLQIDVALVCGAVGAHYSAAAIVLRGVTAAASNQDLTTTTVVNWRTVNIHYHRIDADYRCADLRVFTDWLAVLRISRLGGRHGGWRFFRQRDRRCTNCVIARSEKFSSVQLA